MKKYEGQCEVCGETYSRESAGRPPKFCETCSKLLPYQRKKKKQKLSCSTAKNEPAVQKKHSIKLLGSNSTGYTIPIRKEKESTVKAKESDDACPRCGMWYTPWSQSLPHGAVCPDCVMTHASANSIIELVDAVTILLERSHMPKPAEHWCDAAAIKVSAKELQSPVFIWVSGADIVMRREGKDRYLNQEVRSLKADMQSKHIMGNVLRVLISIKSRYQSSGVTFSQAWVSVRDQKEVTA